MPDLNEAQAGASETEIPAALGDLLTPSEQPVELIAIEDAPEKPKRKRKRRFTIPNLRLYLLVIGLATVTTLGVLATVFIALPSPAQPTATPSPYPTFIEMTPVPTTPFQDLIGMGYRAITLEQVGSIPADTRVRISHATINTDTSWTYTIIAEDEQRVAEAQPWQIGYAPGVIPGMPTPTGEFFDTTLTIVLLEDFGDIPAGTVVSVGSGYYNGYEWIYGVITADGRYADVPASKLRRG